MRLKKHLLILLIIISFSLLGCKNKTTKNYGVNKIGNEAEKETFVKDENGNKIYTNHDLGIKFSLKDEADQIRFKPSEFRVSDETRLYKEGEEPGSLLDIRAVDASNRICCDNDINLREKTSYGLCNSFKEYIEACGYHDEGISLESIKRIVLVKEPTVEAYETRSIAAGPMNNGQYISNNILITNPGRGKEEYLYIGGGDDEVKKQLISTFEFINR